MGRTVARVADRAGAERVGKRFSMMGWACALLVSLLLLAPSVSVRADSIEPTSREKRVRVAASERYGGAGRTHRLVLGEGYRALWEVEIDLPVLDLETQAGGLTPTSRFGGLQTAVLGFVNPEGRSFTFRSTDKDPSGVLHPDLHDTLVATLVQDQMAAQHPGAPLASGVISKAVGVPTTRERMVVMPDDPRLGKFREEFAGMVGTFFEFPTAPSGDRKGFQGATEIIDHDELYELLAKSTDDQVAVEAFLRARLLDILIGDFDRHRKQWLWARFPGDRRWQPIPEDRDMVFVRYEGVGPRLASIYIPILQNYGDEYPSMQGLTLHGWEQDRWLLPALSWNDWERVARDVQSRVTDDVIERAIAALPPEYQELDGARLRHDLRGRRDRMLEGARSFYEHLAGEVDIQTTDDSESVAVTRDPDGSTLVEVRKSGAANPASAPLFSRRFEPADTNDVRIYLRGGDDRVNVTGEPQGIRLRVIGGEGNKLVDDSEGGGTWVYDSDGAVEVVSGPGTRVDTRPYEPPESNSGFVDVDGVPPRDWGTDIIPIPQFSYEKDVGVFLGAGALVTNYGFRKHPWASRHLFSAGYATEASEPRVRYFGQFRLENSNLLTTFDAFYSGIETTRFYGFGNGTGNGASDSFYRARSRQLRAAPALQYTLPDERFNVTAGPWFEWSKTKNGNRLIDVVDPYGAGSFGMIGAFVNGQFDTRRTLVDIDEELTIPSRGNPAAGFPTSGILFDVTAEVSPPAWDVKSTWGAIEGSISAFASAGDRTTFALRVGGRDTWGSVPYFKAATIGGGAFFSGGSTVRGLRSDRFAGDSSVFGNLDIRVFLTRMKLVVPTDVGVLTFADVGRVFEGGQSSNKWHPGYGGGIWIAPLARTNTITLTVADSQEDTLAYLMFGFHY